jgi:hypothetical protein
MLSTAKHLNGSPRARGGSRRHEPQRQRGRAHGDAVEKSTRCRGAPMRGSPYSGVSAMHFRSGEVAELEGPLYPINRPYTSDAGIKIGRAFTRLPVEERSSDERHRTAARRVQTPHV